MKPFKFTRGKYYEIVWTVFGDQVTHYGKYVGTFKDKDEDGTIQHKFRTFNKWAELTRSADFIPSNKDLNECNAKVKEVPIDYIINHCPYANKT